VEKPEGFMSESITLSKEGNSMIKKGITALFSCLVLGLPSAALGGDPILDMLNLPPEQIEKLQGEKPSSGQCPENWECQVVDSFTKPDYKGLVKRYQVGGLTAGKSYNRLVFQQHIGEEHGIIVNTVKVREGGQWVAHAQGTRLPEGRTVVNLSVPAGSPEIVVSFDHGRGARVKVILARSVN
jgi:hypothetical protein